MATRIHVLINGEKFGPYPEAEFRQHLAGKKILRSDLVWREGLRDWIPAGELVRELEATRASLEGTAAPAKPPLDQIQEAAQAGDVEAQVRLAEMFEHSEDPTGAAKWYRSAAEQGHHRSQFHLSVLLAAANASESLQWLRKAAENGCSEAQYTLGLRHANGQGMPQDDAEAMKWFQQAAAENHAVAQCSLGYMYDHGRGVTRSDDQAFKWYRLAAERGDAVAQNNLGMIYAQGQGVAKSESEAAKWFSKAAEQGVPGAQMNLGLLLAKGQGVPQDYAEAYKWFNLASAQGHTNATRNRDLLALQMTKDQIAEGQKRAAQFASRNQRR
jgi:TPR repeat protein